MRYISDNFENWVQASIEVSSETFPRTEIQGLGRVNLEIKRIEEILTNSIGSDEQTLEVWTENQHVFYTSKYWIKSIFDTASMINKGILFNKKNMNGFLKHLNPLRNIFSKGYVDQHSTAFLLVPPQLNIDTHECLVWQVPDKNLNKVTYYRAEVADKFLEPLLSKNSP